MQDEFITCRSCGREVPKTLYCIYCGAALSEGEKEAKPVHAEKKTPEQEVESVEDKPIPGVTDEAFFKIPSYGSEVKLETPSVTDIELDSDTVHMMEELRKYHVWKVKLCGLLADDAVSEEVFTKIYEEYVREIKQFREIRNEKIANYRTKYEEKSAELKKCKLEHEELRARVAVGQIPDSELLLWTPELMDRINSLTSETSILEAKLLKLNDLMKGIPAKEISELEKTARKCIESLDSMIINGKVSDELGGEVLEDLKTVLTLLDSTVRGGKEKELRRELETLEVRYKIGEITLTEF